MLNKIFKKRTILMLTPLFVLIIFGVAKFSFFSISNITGVLRDQKEESFTVVLGQDGFSPADLIVGKGDTVIFTATAGKAFWPASDPHPAHGIYSAFDPRQPIDPDKSWSFKFEKVGTWKYHDHLWPSYRGTIVVEERFGKESAPNVDIGNCQNDKSNPQCWQVLIDAALADKGLDAAFEVLADLYNSEPSFAADCHGFSHSLGGAAYKKFANQEAIALSAKAYYCGYGFYHSFMEALLRAGGKVEEARDFCVYAGRTLAAQTSDAEGACYHGIGRGSVDGGDPRSWGDPQAMLSPGFKLCEFVSKEKDQLYRCITGAYNALEILSLNPKYKLSMIVEDPFWLCPSQPEAYQEPCYTNMLPSLLRLAKNDFSLTAKKVSKIPADISYPSLRLLGYPARKMVTQSLFHEYVRVYFQEPGHNINEGILICRSLKIDMLIPCIEGLGGGHMKYGEPGKEYIKGLAFCGSTLLYEDEKKACFRYVLSRLKIWYPADKVREICSTVKEKYKDFCHE